MQNKPNFLNAQILVNCVLTMDYVNIRLRSRFKNKAKQTQFKPNFQKAKMNVSSVKTKVYERNDIFLVPENKANSNPIKPNFKPASQSDFNQIINYQQSIINHFPPVPRSGALFFGDVERPFTFRALNAFGLEIRRNFQFQPANTRQKYKSVDHSHNIADLPNLLLALLLLFYLG